MTSRRSALAFLMCVAAAALAAVPGCSSHPGAWDNVPGSPRVVVSIPPLYSFVKQVGGEKVAVICLCTQTGPHHYEATANDVVGKARGEAQGNAFRWEYTIALKPGNPLANVRLHQWMYLPEGTETMFTRVAVKKFGIKIAQVTESFQRLFSPKP